MMNKIILILGILFLLVSASLIYLNYDKGASMKEQTENVYQGPVRPTDDEVYFRKTGITRPLQTEENFD